jgi:hypothetical protein
MKVRLVKHELIPRCGRYEVRPKFWQEANKSIAIETGRALRKPSLPVWVLRAGRGDLHPSPRSDQTV